MVVGGGCEIMAGCGWLWVVGVKIRLVVGGCRKIMSWLVVGGGGKTMSGIGWSWLVAAK